MTKAQWLKARKGKVSATDVSKILGLSDYGTALDVFADKTDPEYTIPENDFMIAGRKLEPIVASYFEDNEMKMMNDELTGYTYELHKDPDYTMYSDPNNPLFVSTPDYILVRVAPDGTKIKVALIECKTAQKDHEFLPKDYFIQVQWQMGTTGIKKAFIPMLIRGYKYVCFEVDFDPDMYEYAKAEVTKFWNEHVIPRKKPEPTKASDIEKHFSKSVIGKTVEITPEDYAQILKIKEISAKVNPIYKELSEMKDKIKILFKDAEGLEYAGNIVATYRNDKDTTTLDVKKFAEEEPDLFKKYVVFKKGTRRLIFPKL